MSFVMEISMFSVLSLHFLWEVQEYINPLSSKSRQCQQLTWYSPLGNLHFLLIFLGCERKFLRNFQVANNRVPNGPIFKNGKKFFKILWKTSKYNFTASSSQVKTPELSCTSSPGLQPSNWLHSGQPLPHGGQRAAKSFSFSYPLNILSRRAIPFILTKRPRTESHAWMGSHDQL